MTYTTPNILVVDDETNIRFFLQKLLSKEGYRVTAVASGEEAMTLIQKDAFDLSLVDLKLGGIGGLDVLSALRERTPDAAVIVLTGYASLETAIEALRRGATDYLFKPAKAGELRESVHAALAKRRQSLKDNEPLARLERDLSRKLEELLASRLPVQPSISDTRTGSNQESALEVGLWSVDLTRHIITLAGNVLNLTPTEFDLLTYMIKEAPRVIGQQELVAEVQGYEAELWEAKDTIRYHIFNIRNKIKSVMSFPQAIRTVRGVGYTINLGKTID